MTRTLTLHHVFVKLAEISDNEIEQITDCAGTVYEKPLFVDSEMADRYISPCGTCRQFLAEVRTFHHSPKSIFAIILEFVYTPTCQHARRRCDRVENNIPKTALQLFNYLFCQAMLFFQ